jgi:hypothetical protein
MSNEQYAALSTYAEVFWKLWDELEYKIPDPEDRHMCFMFELELEKSIVRGNTTVH